MSSYFDKNTKRPSRPHEAHSSDGNHPSTEEDGHLHRHDTWSDDIPAGFIPETREEKRYNRVVNRKLDIFLLPLLSILYLFSGLDRSNVGNAETEGFTKAIGASPDDLNLAVSLFFVTFVLFQPVSTAIGRQIGAKHWMPVLMMCWGIVTIAHSFIKGRGALITMRLLVGLFEAGFFPTACFYLSTFYTRFDLAVRIALFYGNYAVAGAFSGALAYGIFHIQTPPLHSWQYLFVIEGIATAVFGVIAWFWLPTGPGTARFLSPSQRDFAVMRMQLDNARYVQRHRYGGDGLEKVSERLSRRDVVETTRDWKTWFALVCNICASVPGQAFSVFLPLVVKGLGYESVEANLMSVPPYVCGAVGLYLFAVSSDIRKERGYHIVGGLVICLVGLIMVVTIQHNGARYAALCIMLFGSYVSAPLTIAWLSGNTPEPGKRSLIIGINGFGNLSGIIGAQLFRPQYSPRYLTPFYVTLALIVLSMGGYLSYRGVLKQVNRRRRGKIAGWSREMMERERVGGERYADRKWTFVYGL